MLGQCLRLGKRMIWSERMTGIDSGGDRGGQVIACAGDSATFHFCYETHIWDVFAGSFVVWRGADLKLHALPPLW